MLRLVARGKIHDTHHEEIQALTYHASKGKRKGIKFHGNKDKGGRSIPTPYQKKKKHISQIRCYRCNKYGNYSKECHGSKKQKHEASTIDLDEDTSHKNPKNEDHMDFF